MIIDGLKINWEHHIIDEEQLARIIDSGGLPISHMSTCRIFKEDEEITHGHSECSTRDIFSKETGRKISLHRALISSDFTKDFRAKVWEAYRTSTFTPRWAMSKKDAANRNGEVRTRCFPGASSAKYDTIESAEKKIKQAKEVGKLFGN